MNDPSLLIEDLTMLLIFLTAWEEKGKGKTRLKNWPEFDSEVLASLARQGCLTIDAKDGSLNVAERGIQRSIEVLMMLVGNDGRDPDEDAEEYGAADAKAAGKGNVISFPGMGIAALDDGCGDCDDCDDCDGAWDAEEFDRKFEERNRRNDELVSQFEEDLRQARLSEKTIRQHAGNVSFFLNDYLNGYEDEEASEGWKWVSCFLGDWFIRKCMFATSTSMRQYAASIKKFYKWMVGRGLVSQADCDVLCATIKQEMPEWQRALERYDAGDPDWWM